MEEENAYADLYASNPDYEYEYEPFNKLNGFSFLPRRRFTHAVGMGSAFGDELRPIVDRLDRLTIIESADTYREAAALPVPTEWRKADVLGTIDLPDGSADLVTCFGVLHHIPNVSHVVNEIGRVTRSGGYALIREPVISMGDWSAPRKGLTPRERGIPEGLLVGAALDAGFEVKKQVWCMFSLVGLFARKADVHVYNYGLVVRLDRLLARSFVWNYRYHPHKFWHKIRPTSVFLVLRKI
ncbi:hypothetical protein MPNTM1_05505 [Mycolicibacterium parafortuitum]